MSMDLAVSDVISEGSHAKVWNDWNYYCTHLRKTVHCSIHTESKRKDATLYTDLAAMNPLQGLLKNNRTGPLGTATTFRSVSQSVGVILGLLQFSYNIYTEP